MSSSPSGPRLLLPDDASEDGIVAGPYWSPIKGDERAALITDVNEQLRNPLPPNTAVQQAYLSCYPAYAILRFLLPAPGRTRESFALFET